jgi:predicted MFS family arabinose efflux permease
VIVLLTALMVPLTVGRDAGWPLWGWVLLLCVPPLAGFFLWLEAALERRGSSPLLRPGLWADAGFRLGLALYLVFFAGVVPFFLYYSIVLQYGLGYSTLAAAAAMVPYAVGTTVVSLRSAWFVATFTAPWTILAGCVVCAVGSIAMLATLGAEDTGRHLALAMTPAMVLTGLGLGLVIGPLLGFVLSEVHSDDSGAAAGLLSTAQQIGASVGVALLGLAFFRSFTGDLVSLGYPRLQDNLESALLVVTAAFVLASLLVGVIARRSRIQEGGRT